jgi:hypothetical protein
MSETGLTQGRRPLFGQRNLIALALGLAALGVGYVLLAGGGTSLPAVLLVLGYCVLIPLAIAL